MRYRIGVRALPPPEPHTCNKSRVAIVLGIVQIQNISDHCSLEIDGEPQLLPLSHCLIA